MILTRDLANPKLYKYTTRSKAVVVDNADPNKSGRIRVDHPLIGRTAWIPYLRNPSGYDVPQIGDIVYLEADSGYYNYPVASGNLTKGVNSPSLPDNFIRVFPTNRGMFSPAGNLLELDDGLAPQEPSGSGAKGIRLTTTDGNIFNLNDEFNKITLTDIGGNSITLQYQGGFIGIQINSAKDIQITAENNITVNATGNAVVSAATMTFNSTANIVNGGLVTNNLINNDPITGIPLTAVGGMTTGS